MRPFKYAGVDEEDDKWGPHASGVAPWRGLSGIGLDWSREWAEG